MPLGTVSRILFGWRSFGWRSWVSPLILEGGTCRKKSSIHRQDDRCHLTGRFQVLFDFAIRPLDQKFSAGLLVENSGRRSCRKAQFDAKTWRTIVHGNLRTVKL